MPPKGKKGQKGGGKKNKKDKKSKYPIVIDGVITNEMSREELETYIVTIRRELEKERNERNYFQLERDRIKSFWDNTTKQLEDAKMEIRNKEHDLEEADEKHQLELKVYRQKVRHLMYEHENTEAAIKADKLTAVHNTELNMKALNSQLRQENIALKSQMRTKQLESEEAIKSLKLNYESQLSRLREDFIMKSKELDSIYQDKMKTQRDQMNLRRKTEIHEIEERKNYQIKTLIDNHDESFKAMKNFYNEITTNNISIIKTLKENIDELKERLIRTDHMLEVANLEVKKKTELCNRLQEVKDEMMRVRGLLDNEELAHNIAKGNFRKVCKENQQLTLENEVLYSQFKNMENERHSVRKMCEARLIELQQKAGLRSLILERKLSELKSEVERKDLQLHQLLALGDMDKDSVARVNQHIEDVLSCKNDLIKKLEYELARTEKSHNDLKATFQDYLSQFNQYMDSTSWNVIKSNFEKRVGMGKGPAGLVSVAMK